MGEHADDTMNYDDEPGDYIVGDGGPQDVAIEEFISGLRALPHEVRAGFLFQEEVMDFLNSKKGGSFVPTRTLIMLEKYPGEDERFLSAHQFSLLNFEESKRGDLTDVVHGTTVECQRGVSGPDVSWEHSKFLHSGAVWQCFGFTNGVRLVIATDVLRRVLKDWRVVPFESKRGGGSYYTLCEDFLRREGGAFDLDDWGITAAPLLGVRIRDRHDGPETQESISEWAEETFGRSGSNLAIAVRANEEMAELLAKLRDRDDDPEAAEEAADVIIVLMRLFARLGVDYLDAVAVKMRVNRGRRWSVTGTGCGYHE